MTQTLTVPIVAASARERRFGAPVAAQFTVLGLGFVAVADYSSRRGHSATSAFFWVGLLLIFVPTAFAALRERASRRERLALMVLLGVALYLVKLLGSPVAFNFSDEFIHLRNTQDILRTHHLFALNPLLPTAAYYPGLGAATAGLVDLTSLSPFAAGVLVIAAARLLFSACFFTVAEWVTGSSRGAVGASLLYAANPMFLFWGAAFSYENLALPLAVFVIWWLAHTRYSQGRKAQTITVLGIAAVSVTHHVVGFALVAVLCAWWLAEGYVQRPPSDAGHEEWEARRRVGFMALLAGAATLAWFAFVARPAASYLFTQNIFPALRQTGDLLTGHLARRHLYTSGGYQAPFWETLAGAAAVGVLLLALPPALYQAWRRRHHASTLAAIAVAVAFPFSLAPRLAPDGVAISGRSSEYIFAGLGCVIGLLAEQVTWRRRARTKQPTSATRARRALWHTAIVAGLMTVVFVGEVTVGTAFYERLPETSKPSGYPWSVQSDVITASKWARENLGINRRFGATAIDTFALATYGEQNTVRENDVWPIFFAPTMNHAAVHAIRVNHVQYLLVDVRTTHGVPPTPGYYFSPQEPNAAQYTHVFPIAALRKFSDSSCVQLLDSVGEVKIYNVSRIASGVCLPPGSGAAAGTRVVAKRSALARKRPAANKPRTPAKKVAIQ